MDANKVEKYEPVRTYLTMEQVGKIASKIQSSEQFDFGELCHIILSGTETPVGYIGDDTAELCFPKGAKPEHYRIPHYHLRRIFASV